MDLADRRTRPSRRPQWLRTAIVFLAASIALFLGFYRNQWDVVREKRFKQFQVDSESLVLARMVESRQHGILSQNGLLGWGDADPLDLNEGDYTHQYDVFLSGGGFQSYSLYKSASGAQALLFSIAHLVSPYSAAEDLRNFRAGVALMLAAALSLFAAWVAHEFDLAAAAFLALTLIVSQWITLFGRNLFYFIWASFLPAALMAWYLARTEGRDQAADFGPAILAFAAVLFKCLTNGYDFIVPALSMPVIPFAYYALRDRWDRHRLLRRSMFLALGLLAAVSLSILILALQLQVVEGSIEGGLSSIFNTLSRRTYADPDLFPGYAASLKADPWLVLWTYIYEDTAIEVLGLRFMDILIIFAGITALYLVFQHFRPEWLPDRNKSMSLIAATWLAVLSPLSWFVLFKGQAFVHTHTNYLAWHMPFTLFGYVMCAWLARCMLIALLRRQAPPPAGSNPP